MREKQLDLLVEISPAEMSKSTTDFGTNVSLFLRLLIWNDPLVSSTASLVESPNQRELSNQEQVTNLIFSRSYIIIRV